SAKLGTPNACNGCHRDRSARWAAAAVEKRWGRPPQHDAHYAEVIAAGRTGARAAESTLVALAGNREQSAIVRATALDLLRGAGRVQGRPTRNGRHAVSATELGGRVRGPRRARSGRARVSDGAADGSGLLSGPDQSRQAVRRDEAERGRRADTARGDHADAGA